METRQHTRRFNFPGLIVTFAGAFAASALLFLGDDVLSQVEVVKALFQGVITACAYAMNPRKI